MASSASDQPYSEPVDALNLRLRVCLVSASSGRGGLEKHVITLANQLAALGHSVSVIVDTSCRHDFAPAVRVFAHRLAGSRLNLLSWWFIFRVLAKLRPDVVHAHAGKAVSMCWLACRVLGIPLVGTLHNRKRQVSVFKFCDRVIAVSRVISSGLPAEKLHVIYNGIERPFLRSSPPDLANDFNLDAARPIFLAVGRLVKAKGFDLLVSAAAVENIQLLIVGDGPERECLEKTVSGKVPIRFLGHRDDVYELMTAADGVVISSRHEGGPIVLAEAMLINKPVISTRVGMVPDFLPTDWLCDTTTASLSLLLRKAAHDIEAWTKSQRYAFEMAQKQLTLSAMILQTIAVYRMASKI